MALMLSVYLGDAPHTVRGLALALKISKPAVSRALDRLGELGYIRRQRDDLDRRNVLVQKTTNGANFLTEFSRLIDDAKNHIASIPAQMIQFTVDVTASTTESVSISAPAAEIWAHSAAE
jgi:DNA-binding MarR family transcriptional regulator